VRYAPTIGALAVLLLAGCGGRSLPLHGATGEDAGPTDLPRADLALPDASSPDVARPPDLKPPPPDRPPPCKLAWRTIKVGTSQTLVGAWGSGPNDVWIVGSGGAVLHFDGKKWTMPYLGPGQTLTGVWGSGPKDVYVLGYTTLHHFDGKTWTKRNPGGVSGYSAIWGTGPDNVLVATVGSGMGSFKAGIQRFDGKTWRTENLAQHTALRVMGMGGSGPADTYAGTMAGYLFHYNGKAWSSVHLGRGTVWSVWGSRPSDIYAMAGAPVHYDGKAWTRVKLPGKAVTLSFTAVWGRSAKEVVLISDTIYQKPPANDVWAYHLEGGGGTWKERRVVQGKAGVRAYSVWGSGPKNIYAVGFNGMVAHYACQ